MPKIQEAPPRKPAYFWWFLLNILALCFAVTSWVVCLHVFGNPEIPRNYEILKRLGRVPEIRRYSVESTPNGASLGVAGLYDRFSGFDPERRKVLNSLLIRNYMRNFEDLRALTYIEGEFQVEDVRLLGGKDFIPQGVAVRTRAMVRSGDQGKVVAYPVVVDFLFSGAKDSVVTGFKRGTMLQVGRLPQCAAILHVDQIEDEEESLVCLTVVPLVDGVYQVSPDWSFDIQAPSDVVPGAVFPVFAK